MFLEGNWGQKLKNVNEKVIYISLYIMCTIWNIKKKKLFISQKTVLATWNTEL